MKTLIALLAATLLAGCLKKTPEVEENETKVTLDQVPLPAREALKREAQGAPITTVDKEDHNGQIIYETDVTINGKNVEIKVDPDGKLISKKTE
jgi:hypothetical protein